MNLDILVNTRVTKIVPVGTVRGAPDMRGVEFAQTANGLHLLLILRNPASLTVAQVLCTHSGLRRKSSSLQAPLSLLISVSVPA